jgi:hypothetical protein
MLHLYYSSFDVDGLESGASWCEQKDQGKLKIISPSLMVMSKDQGELKIIALIVGLQNLFYQLRCFKNVYFEAKFGDFEIII